MERGHHDRDDGDYERSDERNELEQRRKDAEQDGVRAAEQGEADAAHSADQHGRHQLRADVGCQRLVQILDQPVAGQLDPMRQRREERASDPGDVPQQQKRQDGDKDQPRNLRDGPDQGQE